ncbi:hypothetical protein ANO11243_012620 [Dothideomycetidae sp. 11243]|nr:hypothetical protein ANO11243_012620 [fungal sp. No.11243]
MAKPKYQRQGRKLQVSYESNIRLNTSKIYPGRSSNGSTIILSGTDAGLRVTWSGGKALFFASQRDAALTNGNHEPIDAQHIAQEPESDDEALFESDEEDLDDAHPYPTTVQELDIAFDSPVLFLSVPPLESGKRPANIPDLLSNSIVVAVACEDGSASVVLLPLDPPSASAKRKGRLGAHITQLDTAADSQIPRGIALTWTVHPASSSSNQRPRYETRLATEQPRSDFSLTVALATSELSGQIHMFSLPIAVVGDRQHITPKGPIHPFASELLDDLPTTLAISPASSKLLDRCQFSVSSTHGSIHIYETSVSVPSTGDHASRNPPTSVPTSIQSTLRLSAPYMSSGESHAFTQATHKKILSAAWVFSGESLLVLLEDGHIGLYALTADPPSGARFPPKPFSIACEAYIGDAPEHANSQRASGSRSRKPFLAPMTPNTRRAKSSSLFSDPTPTAPSTPRGGIATFATPASNGIPDDAVILWFNNRLFSITSLRSFWAQSERCDGQGSLFSSRSSITALDTPDLAHEIIVDVALLPSTSGGGPFSLFDVQTSLPSVRDILITTEYRTIIMANVRSPTASQLPSRDDDSPTRTVDRRLLERGELGLDGMDRMLDGMVGIEHGGPAGLGDGSAVRRVLFTET